MIKSGDSFIYKGIRYVIGAILSINSRHYIATAAHIFHGTGHIIQANGTHGIMKRFLEDFDVALIELNSDCMAQITEFGSASVMEEAMLMNEQHNIPCRVIQSGASIVSLLFRCFDMPQPGDSGSPIMQKGKVIGLLSSVMLGNCTGCAVSADVLRNLSS